MIDITDIAPKDAAILAEISALATVPAWSESAFRSSLEDKSITGWKLLTDNKTVGFILVRFIFEEAEILNFAIAPQYQRRGYGQILMQNFLLHCLANKIKSIFLEVDENNITAISLYRKFNFTKIDYRERYYRISENEWHNALIMQKNDLTEMIDKAVEV